MEYTISQNASGWLVRRITMRGEVSYLSMDGGGTWQMQTDDSCFHRSLNYALAWLKEVAG